MLDVIRRVNAHEYIDGTVAERWIRQLLMALAYLHHFGILHGDKGTGPFTASALLSPR